MPLIVSAEGRSTLDALLSQWQRREQAWERAQSRGGSPREVSAARGNASATLACIEDLRDTLDGRALRERLHG